VGNDDGSVTLKSLGQTDAFTLTVADSTTVGSRTLTLKPSGAPPSNDVFEVLRLVFEVTDRNSFDVQLTSATANGSLTLTTRTIGVATKINGQSTKGDFNEDGIADLADAAGYLNRLLLPGSRLLSGYTDYSGYDTPTSEDVHALTQFATGRITDFPTPTAQGPRPSEGNATLQLGIPTSLGGNVFSYPINVTSPNLAFQSTEFRLTLNPEIVASVLQLEGDGTETFTGGRLNSNGEYEAFVTYGTQQRATTLARLYVVHQSGKTGSGITLTSALLGEGKYTGNFESASNRTQTDGVTVNLFRAPHLQKTNSSNLDVLGRFIRGDRPTIPTFRLQTPAQAQRRTLP
jgi:hypothetical protein